MTKWFFTGSFFLFLGNWIGQIALNWYVFDTYENAVYLGLINLFRLAPILLLSIWAGKLADRHNRGNLIKITITSSLVVTALLFICSMSMDKVPMTILLIYSFLRGTLSAVETPVRQAVLPDLSTTLPVSKAVSYHSFIINICRSIGPAVSGVIIASHDATLAFLCQAVCYFAAVMLCLPLSFTVNKEIAKKNPFSFKDTIQYFKDHANARSIFVTSLLIMATGFSYTTLLPILTDKNFPDSASIFGVAMTFSAVGGILATLVLPKLLKNVHTSFVYYVSSAIFGISLMMVVFPNPIILFGCIFLAGLFSQWARTTNRIYFQNQVSKENRGKLLSVVMMDRGMIPLGSLLMSLSTEWIGITYTFIIMGLLTLIIAVTFSLRNKEFLGGRKHESGY
ncbi:MFS transporter [Staphylococcus massiliensis]|uniref:MFS transporter n=1 Tax=Staphylococcus massiliensis TaxID=555791 RepID=UPI001EDDA773|nr:MFS transporter [Staphylococcus massiliensis]MCG3413332.1 MFS transporter [Staphylococcus massiliensis]